MNAEENATHSGQGIRGLLARMVWLLAGPMALAIAAAHIGVNEPGTYGWSDALYFGIVAATIAARLLDVTLFDGTTSEGAPATMGHFTRYSAVLAVVSLGLWAGAHWLGGVLA